MTKAYAGTSYMNQLERRVKVLEAALERILIEAKCGSALGADRLEIIAEIKRLVEAAR